jgi:hypothetical protein
MARHIERRKFLVTLGGAAAAWPHRASRVRKLQGDLLPIIPRIVRRLEMKYFLVWVFVLTMISMSFGAEDALSISVLKAEKSGNSTYLLFSVENKSDQTFQSTQWSCVFLNRGDPVHEERSSVDNVPARGRAIQRIIQGYGGPFDKIECRFMRSRP